MFGIAWIFDGKLFHTLGPAIIKALSPLTMFDFGTWSRLESVDRRVLDTDCGKIRQLSAFYTYLLHQTWSSSPFKIAFIEFYHLC